MEIKILGTGCPKCNKLYDMVNEVVKEEGLEANVEKVTEMQKITEAGVMITPALMVDEEVKFTGKVPSKDELMEILG